MHFSSLALAAFAVLTYARPAADVTNALAGPPVHQNAPRDASPRYQPLPLRFQIPTEPSTDSSSRFAVVALAHHNKHRSNHTLPGSNGTRPTKPMAWNETTAATAKKIADTCNFSHQMSVDGGGYGQNLAAGYTVTNITGTITDLWHNGEVNNYKDLYGQAQPSYDNFGGWGHFSQLVWDSSTSLGCWTTDCTAKGLQNVGGGVPPYLTVCNYYPAGNYGGEYAKNIGNPKGDPTLKWDWQ